MNENIDKRQQLETSKVKLATLDLLGISVIILIVIAFVYASYGLVRVLEAMRFSFWAIPLLFMFAIPLLNTYFFMNMPFFHSYVIEFTNVPGDPYTMAFVWVVAICWAIIGYTLAITTILAYGYFLGREGKLAEVICKIALVKKSTIEEYKARR
ncbi:MAG: hypothetical protein ACFFDB_00155 [Promethearchaeota archaeon]